jgi:hypothetical protein
VGFVKNQCIEKPYFDGSHHDVSLGTNNNKMVSAKHNRFIVIKAATCFDPTGSSSGLHYEPTTKKLRTFLGSEIMFTNNNYMQFCVK